MLSTRFDHALSYTSMIHRIQVRKGSGIPYISHLLGVASITLEFGGNEDQAIAALLHDAAEDQGGEVRLNDIRITFGEAVEKIVRDCSDSLGEKKPANEGDRKVEWRLRKEAYLSTLPKKPASSLLVSLADKTHNSEAIVTDVHRSGPSVWGRFTGGQDGTIWYYQELLKFFAAKLPEHVSRLDRAVSEMKTLKIA
jgi:(p)ppGpp synthase/HD superfamily hydrolase